MIGATVTFLLVERDPDQIRRVQQGLQNAKIANPIFVVESLRAAASLSHTGTNGSATLAAGIILLGPGVSVEEHPELLDALDALSWASTPVIELGTPPHSDEVYAAPFRRRAGDSGVPLTHLAELIPELALVITTTAPDEQAHGTED